MSTYDVPGANAKNCDELRALCWAEHEDGSLILVESTEGQRVIYSVFDISKNPPIEYRDSMSEKGFKDHFSWNPKNKKSEKWLWKDKTPFPWDRIIKSGIPDGVRHACARDLLNAAERVAESQKMIGKLVDPEDIKTKTPKHMVKKLNRAGRAIINGIQKALEEINS